MGESKACSGPTRVAIQFYRRYPGVTVYALRFHLYLLVAGAFVFSVSLTPLRPVVNAVFAIVAAYLIIIVGRRRLGTKNL